MQALLKRAFLGLALALQPGDPRLTFLAGVAEFRRDRPEAARALWQELLRAAPSDAPWRGIVEEHLRALP